MGILEENTKWVLFLGASGEPEERHILDLAYGLFCLEAAGVKPEDVAVYIDGKNRAFIKGLLLSGTRFSYPVQETRDFFSDQKTNSHKNIVIFVTGHGSIEGIEASPVVSPYLLISTLKSSPGLEKAVVYLGQCLAGVFNFVGAGRKKPDEADIVLIGATNLHNSLSSPTQEHFGGKDLTWVANLFLLHVFKWIMEPVDVDGDDKKTVIDSYKYAGVMSNAVNRDIKINSFVRSFDLHEKWEGAKKKHAGSGTLQSTLELQAAQASYQNELVVRYTHQECWILNSIPAQHIEL